MGSRALRMELACYRRLNNRPTSLKQPLGYVNVLVQNARHAARGSAKCAPDDVIRTSAIVHPFPVTYLALKHRKKSRIKKSNKKVE